jgi:hypothetical protein
MASDYKVSLVDLDDIFKPRSTAARANVEFKVLGADLADRYEASAGNGSPDVDQIDYNTNYKSSGTDLRYYFKAISYISSPVITVQPVAHSVNETATTTFTIVASGAPTLTYQWRKNGSNLSNAGHYSGVTTATLTISNSSAADAANYDCVVSNGILPDATSNSVALTVVIIPVISGTTGAGNYNEGNVLTLTVSTSAGTAPLSYQWKLNGSDVTVGTGGDTSSYQFTLSTSTDGNYTCVISNAAGSDTSSNVAIGIIAPVISGTTGAGPYDEGDVVTLTVTTSAGTNLSYQWKLNGNNVIGGTGATTSSYQFTLSTSTDGDYTCVVSNGGGSATSGNVTIGIIAPVISSTTGAGPYNEGDVLTLTVTTSAGTNLSYQWKLNGNNVVVGTGATTSSYQFTLSASTDGDYTCVVSNGGGSDTSGNVTISIIAPVIDGGSITGGTGGSPPSGGGTYSLNIGDGANFTVTTSAGANLHYQWMKDGDPVGTDSSSYSFTVAPGDGGIYSVDVSNGGGTVSASATLVVL